MHHVMKVTGYVLFGVTILICGIWALCSWSREEGFVLEREEKAEESKEEGTEEKAEALDPPSEAGNQAGSQGSSPTEAVQKVQRIFVYVCGEVQRPGVYELELEDRIQQAIEAAGGFTEQAAVNYLNLADWIVDGQQIYVPTLDEVVNRPSEEPDTPQGNGQELLVNINTAGVDDLSRLSGIGEQRAKDIITYREMNGAFSCIEDIMKVSGIKESTFNRIKNQICV